MAAYTIETMKDDDWEQVCRIYKEGIDSGLATFETRPPGWEKWDASHLSQGRFVARQGTTVLGWAALSPVSDRCVYAGVAEVSVYVGTAHHGQGVGRALLERLIQVSEEQDIWTLQAGVFSENEASVRLHGRCGFRQVGRRERLGRLQGVWRDVLLLERRSHKVGID